MAIPNSTDGVDLVSENFARAPLGISGELTGATRARVAQAIDGEQPKANYGRVSQIVVPKTHGKRAEFRDINLSEDGEFRRNPIVIPDSATGTARDMLSNID